MAISAQGAETRNRRGVEARAATLYLALFLVLLVFFIFLVSRTTFDPGRSVAVIEGVEAQFATRGGASRPDALPMPAVLGAGRAGLVADAGLAPALASALEVLGILPSATVVVTGNAHVAAIDPEGLFLRDTAAFTAAGRQAVDALGAILADPAPGTVRRLDAELGGVASLAVRRAAALGAALTQAAGPQAVTVHAAPGAPGVQLAVYAIRPDAGDREGAR